MTERYHDVPREGAKHEPARARMLSLRVATLVGLHGTLHPATRAKVGRYWAASGMVPQLGHRLWLDPAFAVGYAREAGTPGHDNRMARRARHKRAARVVAS